MVFSDAELQQVLQQLNTDLIISNVFVGLYTNNIPLSPATLETDLVQPTFTGYAQANPAFVDTFFDPINGWYALFGLANFAPTATPSPAVTVYGYFLLDANTNFLGAEAFSTPRVISANGQAVPVVPKLFLSGPRS